MSRRNRRNRNCDATGAVNAASENSSSPPDAPMPDDDTSANGMSESTYHKERTSLIEIEQKSADQHDRAILTVASGGLALSITFLKDIAPNPLPETWKYLGLSWGCFGLSILTILFSFLTSQSACRKQREFLDRFYQDGPSAAGDGKNRWSTMTNMLNFISYLCVFIAIVFFVFFSWSNLGRRLDIVSDKTHDPQIQSRVEPIEIKGGAVPPKLPASPVMERKPASTPKDNKK